MLARGDEPEHRSFPSWRVLWQRLRRFPLARLRDAGAGRAAATSTSPPPVAQTLAGSATGAAAAASPSAPGSPTPIRRNMQIIGGWLADVLPKGLYARALIIIIAPIVVLEGVVAFVFMERHWQAVTRRLSEATARDIAAVIDIYEEYPRKDEYSQLIEMARDRLNLSMQVLPPGDLPAPRPKPFFALLDRALSDEIRRQVQRPFWIDTVGQSRHVEIRVKLRQCDPALRRHAVADLRLELAHLPSMDDRLVGDPAYRRHPVPAQPDPAHRAARRSGRRVRQGPRRARRFPPARRPRGAPGGAPPSSRCATASRRTSSSAPPCWPASATTCAPS